MPAPGSENRRAHHGAPFAFSVPQSVIAIARRVVWKIFSRTNRSKRCARNAPRHEVEIAARACAISRKSIRGARPARSSRSLVVVRVTIVFDGPRRRSRACCGRVARALPFRVATRATTSCDGMRENKPFATDRIFAGIFLRPCFPPRVARRASCEFPIGRMDVHTSFDPSARGAVAAARSAGGAAAPLRAWRNRARLTC